MLEKAKSVLKGKRKAGAAFHDIWKGSPIGYPRLAERISCKPETGIYRRFDALNARRLLYLQAELCVLEKRLRDIEIQDNNSKNGREALYATDFYCMLEEPVDSERTQLDLIEKLNSKLDQYSKSIIMCSHYGDLHSC